MINHLIILILTMAITINPVTDTNILDEQEHKVVIQVSKVDSAAQLKVVGQVRNILKALPNTRVEVVCHSEGLPMLVTAQSNVFKHVEELIGEGVIFAACENTMKRGKLSKQDLLPGVTTVPSGLAEIILKQEAGWSYIKAGL